MKPSKQFFFYICFIIIGFFIGCKILSEQPPPAEYDNADPLSIYTSYAPQKIDILPLTKILSETSNNKSSNIIVYVSLLDAFNSSIKSPGIFRFELYEYVKRSPQPKGQRVKLCPDRDLLEPTENNTHWRDYFRTYQFNITCNIQKDQSYILQATFITPEQKRLSDEMLLKPTE